MSTSKLCTTNLNKLEADKEKNVVTSSLTDCTFLYCYSVIGAQTWHLSGASQMRSWAVTLQQQPVMMMMMM